MDRNRFFLDLGKLWRNYFIDYYCSLYLQSCPKEGKDRNVVDQESKGWYRQKYIDTF